MEDDLVECTPGTKQFWEHFYDEDGGILQTKQYSHRRAEEIKEFGSLLEHYEWFMNYEQYEESLLRFLARFLVDVDPPRPLRVLHIGCGNSDFCDALTHSTLKGLPSLVPITSSTVLNIDVCPDLIARMQKRFPTRRYAVGDCCAMSGNWLVSDYQDWYRTVGGQVQVAMNGVDFVFDKGTLDALLSAFSGDYNPNAAAYANEIVQSLRPGGLCFLISINSVDTVNSYLLSASASNKSLALVFSEVIELNAADEKSLRVETLGSRYNLYGYRVSEEE